MNEIISVAEFLKNYRRLVKTLTYTSVNEQGIMRSESYYVFVKDMYKVRMTVQEYNQMEKSPTDYDVALSPASQTKAYLKQAELVYAEKPVKKQTKAEKAEKTA